MVDDLLLSKFLWVLGCSHVNDILIHLCSDIFSCVGEVNGDCISMGITQKPKHVCESS